MNYSTFRFTELTNNYYLYVVSIERSDSELILDIIDEYIELNHDTKTSQYLMSIDISNVKIEVAQGISVMDVVNKNFPSDDKNLFTSQSFIALIPPPKAPKVKKEAKPKAEKPIKEPKANKPRGKKSNVNISQDPTVLNVGN